MCVPDGTHPGSDIDISCDGLIHEHEEAGYLSSCEKQLGGADAGGLVLLSVVSA